MSHWACLEEAEGKGRDASQAWLQIGSEGVAAVDERLPSPTLSALLDELAG